MRGISKRCLNNSALYAVIFLIYNDLRCNPSKITESLRGSTKIQVTDKGYQIKDKELQITTLIFDSCFVSGTLSGLIDLYTSNLLVLYRNSDNSDKVLSFTCF